MVERLVANEKVEGSTPFARSKLKVIKSKFITSIFQKFVQNVDIRKYKNNIYYFILFRIFRNFLHEDIILKIYNFRVFGSIDKNKTSYFLLKKCEFGDIQELNTLKKFSKKNNILFIDCGCNYGFYSFFVASLSKNNYVISIEDSKTTAKEFEKNLILNQFTNIYFYKKAVSNIDDQIIQFNESEKDWESSSSHDDFLSHKRVKVETVKIDTILKSFQTNKYTLVFKLDIEGNEMKAIDGSLQTIKKYSPFIIIEFSKYIFDKSSNVEYLKNFLTVNDYSIYDINKNKKTLEDIIIELSKLTKRHKTIGNFYLIKNSSKFLKDFIFNE